MQTLRTLKYIDGILHAPCVAETRNRPEMNLLGRAVRQILAQILVGTITTHWNLLYVTGRSKFVTLSTPLIMVM